MLGSAVQNPSDLDEQIKFGNGIKAAGIMGYEENAGWIKMHGINSDYD